MRERRTGRLRRRCGSARRAFPSAPSASARRARWPQLKSAATSPRTLSGERADWLRWRIGAGPFTLRGLSAELAERGIKTHPRAVWVFVHAEGLSFKKNLAGRGADAA